MTPTMYQHLRADNDRNGNPRRLFLILTHDGGVADIIDEGYMGKGAMNAYPWHDMTELPSIDITTAEYRSMVRNAH